MTKQSKTMLATGIGIAGNVTGILIAVKRKSGFWGGVGWFALGGLAGAALGYIVYSMLPDSEEKASTTAATNAVTSAAKTSAILGNKDLMNISLGSGV